MDNSPVSAAEAATIEAAEARAWEDLYAAAPREWAEEAGVGTIRVGKTLVIRWAATGRRYFSRSIGLGVLEPAQPEQLDEILGVWERAGIDMFLVKSMPQCLPEGYDELLRSRGLEPFDRQDRIVRDARPALDVRKAYEVERVEAGTADEWAGFLQRVYRLETGPWLQRLIGGPDGTSTSRARAPRSLRRAACSSGRTVSRGSAWTAPFRGSAQTTTSPTPRSAPASSRTAS